MASITLVARGSLLEGRIVSDGEVIVEEGAEVRAEVRARKVVIRGVVRGDVIATEVRLEEGGRLIGGLRTPAAEAAVAVAQAASRPVASRTPMAAGIADEIAEAVALDAARELTGDMELTPAPSPLDGPTETSIQRPEHSRPRVPTGAVVPAAAPAPNTPLPRAAQPAPATAPPPVPSASGANPVPRGSGPVQASAVVPAAPAQATTDVSTPATPPDPSRRVVAVRRKG